MNPKQISATLDARVQVISLELEKAGIGDVATIREIAKHLHLSYGFLWSRIRQRELKSVRFGRIYRLRRCDVAKWYAQKT